MTAFAEYLAAIRKRLAQGDATEQTHRAALEHLLEAVGKGITATNEPKRIACGAPDFNITRHKVPLGHVETKDIGISLDDMERGKGANGQQFKRYRDALPNWILTDYLEFRWFVGGEKRLTARLAELDGSGKVRALPEGEQRLALLLESFFTQPALTVGTAKELAERMAGMTRNLRDLINGTFAHGAAPEKDWLQNWLTSFREVLIPDLDEPQFADMFGQTLAYGLFAARVHTPADKTFSREMAAFSLPKTNPFLRKLFAEFAGVDMPETFGWAVDDIVELLKHAAMDEVLKDFGKGKGKEDPVVHFYETFLAAYDPKMRELRGVYYTPEPVVSYIVRSIDYLLKTRFGRPKGLADENTLILDPATGTATFLYFVVRQIYEQFASQKGAWDSYVSQHLLNRLFGFELLMAPYAIAHLKLGLELQQTGYGFASGQRLGVYLTNTLEEAAKKSERLFAQWISEEANAAAEIKREKPILVVLGNPPYSGHSANRSWELKEGKRAPTFIGDLIQDYYSVDGQPLGEKNPKWLQDDYVKFIRWGQWRIERTGAGVLAFITNHGYLDNPTFRGMRQSLMNAFTDIYILNLHGNSKKREKCPDGSPDENVFDIQQGVTLGIFVKEPNKAGPARVNHADLWGLRGAKYGYLFEMDVNGTRWNLLDPRSPLYLFIPQSTGLKAEYDQGWRASNAFPRTLLGPNSHRDDFAVAFDKQTAALRLRDLANPALPDEELAEKYHIRDTRDWKLAQARGHVPKQAEPVECIYRPFDFRYMLYGAFAFDYHRPEVNDSLLEPNVALISTRQTKERFAVLSTARPAGQHKLATPYDGSYLSPLYLYPPPTTAGSEQNHLGIEESHWPAGRSGRRPNLDPQFVADIEQRVGLSFASDGKGDLKKSFGPEDAFNYIYAVFHSPTYRTRYAEFLKSDFPRLPLTSDRSLFAALIEKGSELVSLHLMESPKLDHLITTFPAKGSNVVEKVVFVEAGFSPASCPPEGGLHEAPCPPAGGLYEGSPKAPWPPKGGLYEGTGRVCINGIQYFQGVPREVWEFHIGGYQVLEKWLKDRKGRELTWDDIQHYQKVVVALKETIRLMAEIDAVIEAHGGWPLN
jgi:hypothetical protein